jgi:hypothetical protein
MYNLEIYVYLFSYFFCFEGSGFVKFSHRDMALAAIKALNGTFMMRVKLKAYMLP